MTIKLVSLFATHLDLNGDQSNLKIIQKRLQWAGISSTTIDVGKNQSIPEDADLIFLGHGSLAAWADINESLDALLPQLIERIRTGSAFMAVATGHEKAINFGILPGSTSVMNRISKFEIVDLDGKEVLGYLNSATTAPIIQKQGLLLGTQLHGPIFAKNPTLVDSYLEELLSARGFSAPSGSLEKELTLNPTAKLVNEVVDQVWELERDLANE